MWTGAVVTTNVVTTNVDMILWIWEEIANRRDIYRVTRENHI